MSYIWIMGTIEEEMIGVFAIGTTTTRRIWDYIYLEQIVIQKRSKTSKLGTTVYPLRNRSDIIMPFCRLSNTSFIPSTIRQWNRLDPSLRNVDSIAKFKVELRKRKDISQVPKHYEIGPRKLNIILTQLRCFASFLNYDLFQVNIV
jgi:hypothetical protein